MSPLRSRPLRLPATGFTVGYAVGTEGIDLLRFPAVASRAVFSFLGFPGWGPLHLYLGDGGYPAAAALRLAAASTDSAASAPAGAGLVAGFLRVQQEGEPVPSPLGCTDCDYRYLIVYRLGGRCPLRISAWGREREGVGWKRRCGPMPVEAFLRRFHPCRRRIRPSQPDAWSA